MTISKPNPNRSSPGSVQSHADGETPKQKVKADAQDVKREVVEEAREQAQAGQQQLADGADALSDAIDAAASNLDDHDREGLARYARELSSNLASAAGQLEGRSVDQLAGDAKRLARNNPALFMLGSIAVGFGLSRFFKASAERNHQHDDDDYRMGADRSPSMSDHNVSKGMPLQQPERGTTDTYATSTAPGSGDGRTTP